MFCDTVYLGVHQLDVFVMFTFTCTTNHALTLYRLILLTDIFTCLVLTAVCLFFHQSTTAVDSRQLNTEPIFSNKWLIKKSLAAALLAVRTVRNVNILCEVSWLRQVLKLRNLLQDRGIQTSNIPTESGMQFAGSY